MNIKCSYCKNLFYRQTWCINRNKKRGSKNYCSKPCRILGIKVQISIKLRNHVVLIRTKEKISRSLTGRTIPKNVRKKISKTIKRLGLAKGKNNINYGKRGIHATRYIDGRTPKNELERKSFKNKQFIQEMLERNNYTCQVCGDNKGGNLEVDHIMPWSLFEELRYDSENCRTLCKSCHIKYGSKPSAKPSKWGMSPIHRSVA